MNSKYSEKVVVEIHRGLDTFVRPPKVERKPSPFFMILEYLINKIVKNLIVG